jgi:hypothetical protein
LRAPAGARHRASAINADSALGDGTTTAHDSPEAITLAPGVVPSCLQSGRRVSHLAIGSNGTLYGWGSGLVIGDGNSQIQLSPEAVTLAPGVTATAISQFFQPIPRK